jgi:hypothetical protein
MAQIIKIKRSTTTAAPGSLAAGELAYSEDSRKLFIGRPNDGAVIDIAGELYTDMLDHTAGTLTASSAIVVDADSKIDQLLTGSMSLTGSTNTIATTGADLTINAGGSFVLTHTGTIDLDAQANEILIPDNQAAAVNFTESTNSYLKFVTTNGSETVVVGQDATFADDVSLISDAAVLNFGADSDVNLTHVPDTALLINGSNGFQFRDSTLSINSSADGQLDINADVQLEITAPTVEFNTDGQVIAVGADGDVTLTHVADTALRFNTTMGLQFRDAGLSIASSADGQLDIDADVELEITAPTVDINASSEVNISNALVVGGTGDFAGQVEVASLNVEDLTSGRVTFAAADGELVDSANLTFNSGTSNLVVSGSVNIDNMDFDGNTISTTNANGDLVIEPNGTGVIKVPAGYKDRANFDANTLVPKAYVDAVKQALDIKDSVKVATTGNITLSGAQTIDGIAVSDGDRVLVKAQSTASENGIYVVAAGAWSRADDANISAEVTPGMFVFVEEGNSTGDNGYVLTTDAPITLGSTNLVFTQFSGAGQIDAGDALSKTGNRLDVNDDNITIEVNSDQLRIKGISATAKGDILLGAATNAGYTRHVAPTSGSATANTYLLSMDTSGNALWADTLDGGTF